MRSPHQTRRSGGGPKTSSRYETTNGSGEDDSYDFRADLKLGSRKKAAHQEDQRSSPIKPQQQAKAPVRQQQQKKKASKAPRRKFGRPKEKEYKSGTELLEALGEVADDEAKAAADALGRDLELMGYDLDCETFITKGSSEASEEEDRYASRGLPDASLKSRSRGFERDTRYAMEEEEDENRVEEEDIKEVNEDEEGLEEEDQDEEGLEEEEQEEASVDVRDALNSSRDEIADGLVNDNTMASYQSGTSSKSSSAREEKPSKTSRYRKVVGDQKTSKLVSGTKGSSKVKESKAMRGNKKGGTTKSPRNPAKSTSKSKAKTPEEKSKAIVIEGMSIFNEDGAVSPAQSNPPADFWENEANEEKNGNFAPEDALKSRDPPETAEDTPYHDAEELSYYPVKKKKKSWLPFRRAASTRQKYAFQSDEEKLQNAEVDNEELPTTQQAPASASVLIPAPDLAPDPTPASDTGASACETNDSAINFFEPSVIDGVTTKKYRSWLPQWNLGGETRQEAEEQHTPTPSQPEQSSPVPSPQSKMNSGLHTSQDRVRPQLTVPKPQGASARQQLSPKSPARNKVLLLSAAGQQSVPKSPARNKVRLLPAAPEKGDSSPKGSPPTASLIDLAENGISSESGESIEISEGGGSKSGDDDDDDDADDGDDYDAPPKKVIRVAVDPEKKKSSLFSRFRRNKKAVIMDGTRRMDVIQENENEEGFDVEFIISSGTVGTLYERKKSRNEMPNSDESVAESVETVRTPIPAPTPVPVPAPAPVARAPVTPAPVAPAPVAPAPSSVAPSPVAPAPVVPAPVVVPAVANKTKTKGGGGSMRSSSRSVYEAPSRLQQEGSLSQTPKLANTFSDFVEAIFADTPKTNAPRNKLDNSFEAAGSIASTWGMQEDGPPRLVLADTHLTDISPPEVSPITKTVNDRNLRIVGVSSLLDEDQGPGMSSKPTRSAKEKKMATKPVQRGFFQRRYKNTAPVQSKPKLNYPVKKGQHQTSTALHNKAPLQLQHQKEKLAQHEQDSRWRRAGQAKQQKEIPPPPIEAKEKKNAMEAIKPGRFASRLTEASSAAAVGSSLGVGPLPTFWSTTAAGDETQQVEPQPTFWSTTAAGDQAQQYEPQMSMTSKASSVASASTRGTWNEIVDASRIVGKAFKSVELSPSDYEEDNPEDRLDNLMSMVSEDSSLGDVERALEVLKKHANRLGIRESDLLQSLKSDEDALLRNLRSKNDMKSEIKFVKSEEDEREYEREDESLYISGVASGILSGDDGDDEEASIRSLTLAEELLYAFQVYTTGVPTKK
jgi:hypothetical protein